MHLLRVEVRHWRGLQHQTLDRLSEGLNLVVGPNESGKSRLFEAIQFGLLESSRGSAQHKQRLQSNDSSELPEVTLHFQHGGQLYKLWKRFVRRQESRLEGDGTILKDEDAERHLMEMLGITASRARREMFQQPELLGHWPLLWVPQGRSLTTDPEALNESSRRSLADYLAKEVGETTEGPEGAALQARIQTHYERYWTKTGKVKTGGPYEEATRALQQTEERLDQATRQWQESRAKADELESLRQAPAELEQRITHLKEKLETAREAAIQMQQLQQSLERQRSEAQLHAQTLKNLTDQQQRRTSLIQALDHNKKSAAKWKRSLETNGRKRSELERAIADLEATLEEIEQRDSLYGDQIQEMDRLLTLEQKQQELHQTLEHLKQRHEIASEWSKAYQEARHKLAELPTIPTNLKTLYALEKRLEKKRTELETRASMLQVRTLAPIRVGGESHKAGETLTWTCPDTRRIVLDDLAEITVMPRGGALVDLQSEINTLESQLKETLQRHGLKSLAQAQEVREQRNLLTQTLGHTEKHLNQQAPEGMDRLKDLMDEQAWQINKAQKEITVIHQTIQTDHAPVPAQLKQIKGERQALDQERIRVHMWLKSQQEALSRCREQMAGAESSLKAKHEQRTRHEQELKQLPDPQELEKVLEKTQEKHQKAQGTLATLEQAWQVRIQEDPQELTTRLRKSLLNREREREALQQRKITLETQLESAHGAGLYEAKQIAEADLYEARARYQQVAQQAEAIRHLKQTYEDIRQETRERLTQPVVRHITPHLRRLFPGSELAFDDNWSTTGLQTGHQLEPFQQLSGGAREQINTLIRLGLGQILSTGERMTFMLDEPFTHTDRKRLEAFQSILAQFARSMQILMFTSKEKGVFDDLGVEREHIYELPPGRIAHT